VADSRAFRGLPLVFFLSFVNLVGVLVTAAIVGGVAPWTRWQFIGLYGTIEFASGLANVVTPNLWRLPIAEQETSSRSDVKLAASTVLIPHWGGLARAGAGFVFLTLAAWHEGVGPVSVLLVPLVAGVAISIVALSAVLGRAGVARPNVDVVQFGVRWLGREKQLTPISIGASVLQFLLSIVTIPAAKLLPPSVLYQPEIGPSASALVGTLGVTAALVAIVWVVWAGRIAVRAPREQQREAEQHS
jgi:hypothetical protein